MADTASNTGTTATVAVGGSYTDKIETVGDHDWIRLDLRAGQSVEINVASSGSPGLSDPVVTMRDSAGTVLRTVDAGFGENFFFTATAAGPYYIDVSGFESGTGQYTAKVTNYVRPSTEVADQWHLSRLGDMAAVWADYTGRGVHVGIYDSGVQYTHADLDGNYDASRHVTVNGEVLDPTPSTDGHGTSVAGLIASEDDGVGTKGVAYGAGITGVNIFEGPANLNDSDKSGFLQAVDQSENFDVINHSWGRPSSFVGPQFSAQLIAEWFEALADGRGGLGTVQVNSAGNENRNSEGISYKNTRATILVGAYDDTGDASNYSSFGANLLVSAPSNGGTKGLVTTDLLGDDGYEPGDYTNKFGGTSGATPIVTGVVALMMQANANLGWRDVREILGLSATSVGSGVGGTKTRDENDLWFFNNAATWNGGGLHFSRDYGFGAVNAYNAVRMAEAWSLFGAPATTANESRASVGSTGSTALTDNGATSVSFDFGNVPFRVESVDVSVDITHAKLNSLVIELVSATGAVVKLFDRDYNEAGTNLTWSFSANAFLGESGQGLWTVRVTDTAAGNTGTLNSATVTLNGSSRNLADDVYHYTDEFSDTLALAGQGGRTILSDTDGGVDWIEAAAVRTNTSVDLTSGTATIDGVALRVSGIENVLAGDGNDDLTGDDGSNRLLGMRGDDLLQGGGGDDWLEGGAGGDLLFGQSFSTDPDSGIDTASYAGSRAGVTVDLGLNDVQSSAGDAAGDFLVGIENLAGSGFSDVLTGDAKANVLTGGAGDDTLRGGGGADVLEGGAGGDLLDGGDGIDTISYAGARSGVTADIDQSGNNAGEAAGDRYINVEAILGSAFDDVLRGAAEDNRIEGGAGNDTLDGRGGDDVLIGGSGNDTYVIDIGTDRVIEAGNGGTDTVRASVSFSLAGQYVENLTLTGTSAVDATGNGLANVLTGNAGANRLNGGTGADRMAGGGGGDVYVVDNAGDRVVEGSNAGMDTVEASVSFSLAGQHVETLILTGTGTISGTGNSLANRLAGNGKANRLDGGAGADILTGGGGSDVFGFSAALGSGVDRITDFSPSASGNDDLFLLSGSVFGLSTGMLKSTAFKDLGVAGAALDASDRIVYDRGTGFLAYDADGSGAGAAVQFAALDNRATLTAADFKVA